MNGSGGNVLACLANEIASHTSDGGGDILDRCTGEDALKTAVRLVDKDGAGYTGTERNAEHLTDSHEADAVGNVRGSDLQLRNGEASLAVAADTNSKKNCVAVYFGICSMFIGRVCIMLVSKMGIQSSPFVRRIGLTKQSTTDDLQRRAKEVPWIVVAGLGHEVAIDEDAGREENNKRQHVDRRLEGGGTTSELEVQWKVVDGDECSKCGKHCSMLVFHGFGLKQVAGSKTYSW